jgi:phosphoesterase RecJ-like protein
MNLHQRRVAPPASLVEALKAAKKVALFTHVNPDGDGLGSQAALAEALEKLGKTVVVANHDATPEQYAFLGLENRRGDASGADTVLSLDCPVLERLGERGRAAFEAAPVRLSIDHHVAREPFADPSWTVETCAATGELIEALVPALGVELTPRMATALYAALVNDTGCFRHSNTDAHVFLLAARLLLAGADNKDVNRRLLDEKPLRTVRLQAEVLGRLRSLAGGRAALVGVSLAQLERHGATWEDTDGLAESLRGIAGVEVGAMLREEGPQAVKLSLRSKYDFDVNRFASRWGGGGHAKAAGATLKMPFEEAVETVAETLEAALVGR